MASDNTWVSKIKFQWINTSKSLIVLIVIFISTVFIGMPINFYDEGIALSGAWFVSNGLTPQIDFQTIYPPLLYYVNAFFMYLGSEIIHLRILSVCIIVITAYLLNQGKVNIYFLLSSAILFLGNFFSRHILWALLIVSIILFIERKQLKFKDTITGILIGILVFIRHDFAWYAWLAIIFTLLLNRSSLKRFLSINLSIFIVSIIAFVLLGYDGTKAFFEQSVRLPAIFFADYRNLPYPNILFLGLLSNLKDIYKFGIEIFLFWIYPLSLFAVVVTEIIKKKRSQSAAQILCFFLLFQSFVRSDIEHILPFLLVSIPVISSSSFDAYKKIRFTTVASLLVISFVFHAKNIFYNRENLFSYTNLSKERRKINTNYGYIGLSNHSSFVSNEVAYYYLLKLLPVSKYFELQPGIATKCSVQNEIINSIESRTDPVIIITRNHKSFEPNLSSQIGCNKLDLFLQTNFRADTDSSNIYSRLLQTNSMKYIPLR